MILGTKKKILKLLRGSIMKKRLKLSIVIGVVFLLVVGVLGVNWYIGRSISREIEAEITEFIERDAELEEVSYSNLVVNPLLGTVTIDEVSVVERNADFEVEDIKLKLSLTDIINSRQHDDFFEFITEEINYLDFRFNNLRFSEIDGVDSYLNIEELVLKFDGNYEDDVLKELNEFNFELKNLNFNDENSNLDISEIDILFDGYFTDGMWDEADDFLAYDQKLDVSISDINFDVPELVEILMLDSQTAAKLLNIDKMDFELDYSSGDNLLAINDIRLDTPIVESESSYRYYFNEDYQIDDIYSDEGLLLKAETEGYMNLEAEDLAFGNPDETGRVFIDKIKLDNEFDSELNYEDLISMLTSPSQAESEFLLEGLRFEFSDMLRQEMAPTFLMLGLDLDDLRIDHFSFNSNETLEDVVYNSEFRSPLLDMDFNFELAINDEEPEMSEVKELEFMVSNLTQGLEMLLVELSHHPAASLTDDGQALVFSKQGYLSKVIEDLSMMAY